MNVVSSDIATQGHKLICSPNTPLKGITLDTNSIGCSISTISPEVLTLPTIVLPSLSYNIDICSDI